MPYKDENVARLKRKEYYLKNKESMLEQNSAWAKANVEHVRLSKKLWVQNLSDEKRKEYNEKAKIRYHANKQWNSDRKKIYRSNNKHIINANSSKRRASQKSPAWLTEFDKLKIKCIYSIASMLTRENKEPWHVDHIIPLQGKLVSGLHVPSNLWFIRGSENCQKGNKFEAKGKS